MVAFLPIIVHEVAVMVDVLIHSLQSRVLAVILVVVHLHRNDGVLVQVHGVLSLSEGVWQHRCGPLFVGLQLGVEINAFVGIVGDVIFWRNSDAVIVSGRSGSRGGLRGLERNRRLDYLWLAVRVLLLVLVDLLLRLELLDVKLLDTGIPTLLTPSCR